MATFDDTSGVLWSDGRTPGPFCSPLPLDASDVSPLSRRLPLLTSLIVELSPRRSLAFLLDPRRMSAFTSWRDRRDAEHVRCCVRDVLSWDADRGLERLAKNVSKYHDPMPLDAIDMVSAIVWPLRHFTNSYAGASEVLLQRFRAIGREKRAG